MRSLRFESDGSPILGQGRRTMEFSRFILEHVTERGFYTHMWTVFSLWFEAVVSAAGGFDSPSSRANEICNEASGGGAR